MHHIIKLNGLCNNCFPTGVGGKCSIAIVSASPLIFKHSSSEKKKESYVSILNTLIDQTMKGKSYKIF